MSTIAQPVNTSEPGIRSTTLTCPKCGSDKITVGDTPQGFAWKKGAVGAVVLGPLGLLGGFIGKDRRHVHARCNACFTVFDPTPEARAREQITTASKARPSISKAHPVVFLYVLGVLNTLPALFFHLIGPKGGSFAVAYLIPLPFVLGLGFWARRNAKRRG